MSVAQESESSPPSSRVLEDTKQEDGNYSSSASDDGIASTEPEPDLLSGVQLWMLIFAISLAGFLYSLDVNIIVTAIPVITTHFHTIDDIGWYGSAYLITLCACAPLTGKLYQYYSLKITFFIFVAIFEVGSLICGVAPSSKVLIIGRAIAGIGGAGLFTGGFTIVAQAAPKDKRQQSIAFVYVFSMIGSIIAPLIGGALTEKASWRWCFYINLPAGAVTLAVIVFVNIPEPASKKTTTATIYEHINRLDPIGFVLSAPASVMVLLALQWGGTTYAWNSSTIIGLFVGSAATLVVLIFWEYRRGESAMIPLHILRRRVVYSSCLVVMTQYGSLNIFAYYIPVWFQTIKGASPIESGVYYLATAATMVVSIFITGTISAKLGLPTASTLLGNALATISAGLISTFTPSTPTRLWVGYQILSGLGRGMTLQQPINLVQHHLSSSEMAVGTSLIVFCQYFGGALFIALAETDFSSSLRSALGKYAEGVDVGLVASVGAAGVRGAVSAAELGGVLKAYNQAIVNVFYLGCACSGAAFCAAWGMGFERTRSKAHEKTESAEE